jgi:hypothetical protein
MTQDKQATVDKNPAKLQQGRFTIFDALPIVLALAIAIFSAMYVEAKFGILASIGAFIVVAILAFLIIGYAFHIFFSFVFWLYGVIAGHKR